MTFRACAAGAGLALGLVLSGCAALPREEPPSLAEAAAEQAIAEGGMPGVAVLEIRNGRIFREAVRGVRAAGGSDPVRPGDVWHHGSNGKPITATLVARLVERGLLSWDAPLRELLPELAAGMRPEFRDVTLTQLLSHRSGLASESDSAFIQGFFDDARSLPEQRRAYLQRALSEEPAVPAGAYNYSNTAFLVAAAAAERATGRSFEDLVRAEIFRPLGMRTAGFGPTRIGQPLGHEDGAPLTGPRADNPLMWAPAGAIHMSLYDYGLFVIDQMQGERGRGKLLKASTYRLLHQPVPDPTGARSNGLDWGVRQEPYGRHLMHAGSNGYWVAVVSAAPDVLNAAIVAGNAEGANGERAAARALKLVRSAWPAQPSAPAATARP